MNLPASHPPPAPRPAGAPAAAAGNTGKTASGDAVIRLNGIAKRYGSVVALADITMTLPPGPVGLLGPNGAGKTTLIKVLLGLTVPTAGEARIAGMSPRTRRERLELRRRVGYMPESDCLIPGTTAIELISTLGKLVGLSAADAITRAHEVLDYVQLDEARYRPIEGFSTGMKQRLKLAQALVHDPPVLLLDEPTNGLDPKGRRQMLALVEDLGRGQGKNVLLCSHLLPDVERTCDHVVVLDRGRVALQGDVATLTRAEAQRVVLKTVQDGARLAALLGAPDLARAGWSVEPLGRETYRVTLPEPAGDQAAHTAASGAEAEERGAGGPGAPRSADVDELLGLAAAVEVLVESVEPVRSTLEEVFLGALGNGGAHAPSAVGGAA
ncbi:MAG: ABC transporter ATP-binding protein [Planctomycetota bacterium]